MGAGTGGHRPPGGSLAGLLLRPFLGRHDAADALAVLEELFQERAGRESTIAAGLWYWREVARCMWEALIHRAELPRRRRSAQGTGAVGTDAGVADWLSSVGWDVRYAARTFVRKPTVTVAIVMTIALAVGANTAVFSFADALILRAPDIREPSRLVGLLHRGTYAEGPASYSWFSYPDYVDLRDGTRSFEGLAASGSAEVDLGAGDGLRRVEARIVSGNYFSVVGVRPLAGRTFVPEEDQTEGTHPVTVIGDRLWRSAFASDPGVVGRTIQINGYPFTVVGVVSQDAATLDFTSAAQLWVPLMMHTVVLPGFSGFGMPLFYNRGTHWLDVVGRLADGADRGAAQQDVATIAGRQAVDHPETNKGWGILAFPALQLRAGWPGANSVVRLTGLVGAVVGLVLLIACANIANLLLARSISRRGELGIRAALGAGRVRLARQQLTEALLVSVLGTLLGVGLAYGATGLLNALAGVLSLPGLVVRLDGRVAAFAAALALVTGAGIGILPALRIAHSSRSPALRTTLDRSRGGGLGLAGRGLVTVQVALSLTLVAAAALAIQTVWNLRAVPLGFDVDPLRLASLQAADPDAPVASLTASDQAVLRAVSDLPGVESAALAHTTPFGSRRMANDVLWRPEGGSEFERVNADMNVVSPGYFATLGISLVRGRDFTDADADGGPPVFVVNETLAHTVWPDADPIGKTLWMWSPDGAHVPHEVVGVVADGRYYRSWRTERRPFVFMPLTQSPMRSMVLHVRGRNPVRPADADLRDAIHDAAPSFEHVEIVGLDRSFSGAISLERASAILLGSFGTLAMLIAMIGIYGTLSFSVSQRTREMGIRLALGGRPASLYAVVVGHGMRPLLLGVLLGATAAYASTALMRSLLYGVEPGDPLTLLAASTLLVVTGVTASLAPAYRAAHADPLESLKPE